MRKTIAILLTVTLLACSGSAFAGRLDYMPAPGDSAPFTSFTGYFSSIASRMGYSGYSLTWSSEPYEDGGYEVYEGYTDPMDDGSVDISVYTINGNVEYFIITGSMYSETGTDGMAGLYTMEKAFCLAGVPAFCMAEFGKDGKYTSGEISEAVLDGWGELVQGLAEAAANPDGTMQYAAVTTVLGYPVGVYMYQDGSTLVMYVYVMNRNSKLWVE